MAADKTNLVKHDAKIRASKQLWDAFNDWMKNQGCTSLTEGLRVAMRIVTNFNGNNQEKST
jgi:hypothetical protein